MIDNKPNKKNDEYDEYQLKILKKLIWMTNLKYFKDLMVKENTCNINN